MLPPNYKHLLSLSSVVERDTSINLRFWNVEVSRSNRLGRIVFFGFSFVSLALSMWAASAAGEHPKTSTTSDLPSAFINTVWSESRKDFFFLFPQLFPVNICSPSPIQMSESFDFHDAEGSLWLTRAERLTAPRGGTGGTCVEEGGGASGGPRFSGSAGFCCSVPTSLYRISYLSVSLGTAWQVLPDLAKGISNCVARVASFPCPLCLSKYFPNLPEVVVNTGSCRLLLQQQDDWVSNWNGYREV